ncbi:tol-pal system protein YbgF [Haliea sp. E17]|uniref:tol-pal system protein YbgF n=1 Tax=Haliea sp. E17 TaxID=3401576 RepID=UPI003AADFC03
MFNEVQQLRQEVMRLNGRVEELSNELNQLKSQSLDRYRDLDQRLGGSAAGAGPSASVAPAAGGAIAMGSAQEIPGEADAYRAAYALVREQSFKPAVDAFNAFLRQYPDGKYAPNAHYWLGELYLVIDPPDPEASRQAFSLLLSEYPDNPKAPDAMFKLGKVYYLKGNRAKSREYLDRVINEYGNSNSSAVQMARDFITQNF